MKRQSGFAVLEVLLLVVVVGILGFTAVNYYNRTAGVGAQEAATATVPAAPQVSSTVDLTTAENTVDNMDVDASSTDEAQLDSELNNF